MYTYRTSKRSVIEKARTVLLVVQTVENGRALDKLYSIQVVFSVHYYGYSIAIVSPALDFHADHHAESRGGWTVVACSRLLPSLCTHLTSTAASLSLQQAVLLDDAGIAPACQMSTHGGGAVDAGKKRKPSTVTEFEKVYVCAHPGCGKSFMRSDHLTWVHWIRCYGRTAC